MIYKYVVLCEQKKRSRFGVNARPGNPPNNGFDNIEDAKKYAKEYADYSGKYLMLDGMYIHQEHVSFDNNNNFTFIERWDEDTFFNILIHKNPIISDYSPAGRKYVYDIILLENDELSTHFQDHSCILDEATPLLLLGITTMKEAMSIALNYYKENYKTVLAPEICYNIDFSDNNMHHFIRFQKGYTFMRLSIHRTEVGI